MTGRPASLLRQGVYPLAWVKGFYEQTSTWWEPNADRANRARKLAFDDRVSNSEPLLDAWQYVMKLVPAGTAGRAA